MGDVTLRKLAVPELSFDVLLLSTDLSMLNRARRLQYLILRVSWTICVHTAALFSGKTKISPVVMVAKFISFHIAKGNSPSTKLRSVQQISTVIPCVVSGKCPGAKTWDPAHVAQCTQWYANLKSDIRIEVDATPKRKCSVGLADVWTAAESEWGLFLEAYQVCGT